MRHSPGVGFGQVVGVGINLMNGKEPGPCSTCSHNSDSITHPQLKRFSLPSIWGRIYVSWIQSTRMYIILLLEPGYIVQVISSSYKYRNIFKGRNKDLEGEVLLPCKALKPCSGTLEEPVTNCSSRALLSSSKDSTAFQNHLTMLLSGVQCFSLVFAFQSEMSIFPKPHTISWRKTEGINYSLTLTYYQAYY